MADRRGLVVAKSFYFVFFAAIGCIAPYFNVYLEMQGLNGVQIGWLGSIPPLIALISNPFWGGVADRWQMQTLVLAACTMTAGLVSSALHPGTGVLAAHEFGDLCSSFFRAPIPAITDSAVMAMVTRTGRSYGRQRLWGSVGFVLASFGLGQLDVDRQTGRRSSGCMACCWASFSAAWRFVLPIERFAGRVNIAAGLRTLGRMPQAMSASWRPWF